jgi:hypothetical protein
LLAERSFYGLAAFFGRRAVFRKKRWSGRYQGFTPQKEAIYLKRIGIDLGILDGDYIVTLHEDSQACIKIAENPCLTERTKHFDIKYHRLREQIKKMDVKLSCINTHDQLADIFTKPLGFIQHNLLKNRMTGYDVWLFVRVGVLELAASPHRPL